MNLSDFDYPLPKELIAQQPLENRDQSRLLVVHRQSKKIEDRLFSDLPEYLNAGDALVLNDTKVFKARVLGNKKLTGGKVDMLLLTPTVTTNESVVWRALIQPALKEGQEVVFPENVQGFFAGRDRDGTALMRLTNVADVHTWVERVGTMPLPPYIKREAGKEDEDAYQTVYAQNEGAVAAPTAGLHFTQSLLSRLKNSGVNLCRVTLHVGYGTFKPVEDLEHHQMHSESFVFDEKTAELLRNVRKEKKSVCAVGTTSLRVLETCVRKGRLESGQGETDLFIKTPFDFEAVDKLITNFHLPKTTLLLLVSAFMGEELRRKVYQHAIDKRYRFYSYGDAMLIL